MEKRDRIIIQGNIYITGIDEKKYKKISFVKICSKITQMAECSARSIKVRWLLNPMSTAYRYFNGAP